jgi:cell division septation protein DedD
MPKQKLEIECPVCDAKLSIDARSCPKCGADLGMADFQDLEKLANDISGGTVIYETSPVKEETVEEDSETVTSEEESATPKEVEPVPEKERPIEAEAKPAETPKEEKTEGEESAEAGKKKGLFSKFFGKKK